MESISSSCQLMEPRGAFPMGSGTVGNSTCEGWKLSDVSYFG